MNTRIRYNVFQLSVPEVKNCDILLQYIDYNDVCFGPYTP